VSDTDDFIRAVEQATGKIGRRVGRDTELLCPAHDDHNPSLKVREGDNGKPIAKCWSRGCSYEQIVANINWEPRSDEEWTPFGPAVEIYDYVNEHGTLLYQVCRTADKQFPQRQPDATSKSGWRWKLDGITPVPYHLPRVIAAIGAGETVYVAEGEKDVHALERAGAVATCNSGGAGNWRDTDSSYLVSAVEVDIVADLDEAGFKHARKVSTSIRQAANGDGPVFRLLQPAAGKDPYDHFAAGFGIDDLLELDAAPPPDAESEQPQVFRLTVRTAREIDETPDPPTTDMLLGPFITRGERTIVVGDTGHGKTTICLQMLSAILHGEPLFDHPGAGEGPVMVVDLEQGRKAIKRGLRDAELHDRDDVLHISVPDGLALDRDEEHVAELERVITTHTPVCLLLDPYYKAHRADDSNQERPIVDLMRVLDGMRARHRFALLLPAHPRKDLVGREGARKLTLHDVAGSGAVTRGAEIVLGIERLNHGYARLRYLKDREGELPIGEHISLLFDKTLGFRLDPREDETDESIERRILATESGWKTALEWSKEFGIRKAKATEILGKLAESKTIAFMVGPPGRSKQARCYGTVPECWEQSGTPGTLDDFLIESEGVPTVPPPVGGTVWEHSNDPGGPEEPEHDDAGFDIEVNW
jgi:hypothetical protein